MIQLNKVLPINLLLNEAGKKVPIGGMHKQNRVTYQKGMRNFAIYMADYPNLIVLDLDTREHPLAHLIDTTYTHKTRKGWHLFFTNTYNIQGKRQMQKQKFDLLAGNNWCFFNYDDPEIAYYQAHNELPIAPMPKELYDIVRIDVQNGIKVDLDELSAPLIQLLKRDKGLFHGGRWTIENSSELAHAVVHRLIGYTDNQSYISAVLQRIPEINEKHSQDNYLANHIKKVRAEVDLMQVTWKSLGDYRVVNVGNKLFYVDLVTRALIAPGIATGYLLKGIDKDMIHRIYPQYTGVTFAPDTNDMFVGQKLNTFGGWVHLEDDYQPDPKDYQDFLDYLKVVLCSGDQANYTYLLKYIAHMVQKPNELPGVAIVLAGPEKGTGKDTLHVLLRQLFLNPMMTFCILTDLQGKFNAQLEGALLASAEELVFGGDHRDDSRLKSLLTTANHRIERKGSESYQIPNYLRVIITSNSERPVMATDGERRYFTLRPNPIRKGDMTYWANLYNNFNPRALLAYLRSIDLTDFNIRNAVTTQELQEIIKANRSPAEVGFLDWLADIREDMLEEGEVYLISSVHRDLRESYGWTKYDRRSHLVNFVEGVDGIEVDGRRLIVNLS